MNKDEKIENFITLVLEENEKINLTAISDKDMFYDRHIADSLYPSNKLDFHNKEIMDLGSGAGFPGIPLAIEFSDSKFNLVEPLKKRCIFLEEVKNKLELDNVIVLNIRSEDLPKNKKYDIIVTRAVASLRVILEISIPFLKVDGVLVAYKGNNYAKEIAESRNALKELGVEVLFTQDRVVDSNIVGTNIFIKKIKETSEKYPRPFSQIKKKPL